MTLEQIGEMTDYQLQFIYCKKREKGTGGDSNGGMEDGVLDYDTATPAQLAAAGIGGGGGTVSADDFFAAMAKMQAEQAAQGNSDDQAGP